MHKSYVLIKKFYLIFLLLLIIRYWPLSVIWAFFTTYHILDSPHLLHNFALFFFPSSWSVFPLSLCLTIGFILIDSVRIQTTCLWEITWIVGTILLKLLRYVHVKLQNTFFYPCQEICFQFLLKYGLDILWRNLEFCIRLWKVLAASCMNEIWLHPPISTRKEHLTWFDVNGL